MKKAVLGILAATALTFSLASCGEKLLTEEQVQAEITKGVEAGKPAIETEESAACDQNFETLVAAEVDVRVQAAAAEEAAAAGK